MAHARFLSASVHRRGEFIHMYIYTHTPKRRTTNFGDRLSTLEIRGPPSLSLSAQQTLIYGHALMARRAHSR